MILTITMNPSVDISYQIDSLKQDDVNRCSQYKKTAGGKGLNVARVIKQLSDNVTCSGFLGGDLGHFIKNELQNQGIGHQFFDIEEPTRNCIAILHEDGKQTEILESGPTVTDDERQAFEQSVASLTKDVDVVTISGSLPKGIPSSFYVDMLRRIDQNETKVILDSSGDSLLSVLNSDVKPFAIKPNSDEIQDITGQEFMAHSVEEKKEMLSLPLFDGIPLIMMSLGANGAFVKYQGEFYQVDIPKIEVINPVGSGDSSVAGLALALDKGADIEEVLKTSMTLGLLNTMEAQTGYINPLNVATYYELVTVTKL